jgi:hypothetical protein
VNRRQIFLSAIRGADGTVNVGYLVLIRSGQAVIVVIATLIAGAFADMFRSPFGSFPLLALGQAIACVLGAYAGLLAAVGAFLWGDSNGPQSPTTSPAAVPPHPLG